MMRQESQVQGASWRQRYVWYCDVHGVDERLGKHRDDGSQYQIWETIAETPGNRDLGAVPCARAHPQLPFVTPFSLSRSLSARPKDLSGFSHTTTAHSTPALFLYQRRHTA